MHAKLSRQQLPFHSSSRSRAMNQDLPLQARTLALAALSLNAQVAMPLSPQARIHPHHFPVPQIRRHCTNTCTRIIAGLLSRLQTAIIFLRTQPSVGCRVRCAKPSLSCAHSHHLAMGAAGVPAGGRKWLCRLLAISLMRPSRQFCILESRTGMESRSFAHERGRECECACVCVIACMCSAYWVLMPHKHTNKHTCPGCVFGCACSCSQAGLVPLMSMPASRARHCRRAPTHRSTSNSHGLVETGAAPAPVAVLDHSYPPPTSHLSVISVKQLIMSPMRRTRGAASVCPQSTHMSRVQHACHTRVRICCAQRNAMRTGMCASMLGAHAFLADQASHLGKGYLLVR